MHSRIRSLAFTAAAALAVSACADLSDPVAPDGPQAARLGQQTVRVIVTLDADFAPGGHAANQARAAEIARSLGTAPTRAYGTAMFGFAGSVPEGRLNALDRDPRVASWEHDQIAAIPAPRANAPRWCADNPSHPACADGGADDGGSGGQVTPWGVTRVGGAGAGSGTAWIIDSGVDLDHPDLNVDVARSRNFATRGKDSPDDGNGHGTHVAGTIGAIDDSQGVVGVAPGVSVVAVRVLDNSGSGFYSDVIAGVDYAASAFSAGDVANMSLGGPPSAALDAAIQQAAAAGLDFSLAAGNDGDDAGGSSPARVEAPNVWTVSALDTNDCLTSWSNWGSVVDVAAPGSGILSTWKGGGTNTISGTSMAAPHVAGLLLSGWNGSSHDGNACSDPDGSADPIAHR